MVEFVHVCHAPLKLYASCVQPIKETLQVLRAGLILMICAVFAAQMILYSLTCSVYNSAEHDHNGEVRCCKVSENAKTMAKNQC